MRSVITILCITVLLAACGASGASTVPSAAMTDATASPFQSPPVTVPAPTAGTTETATARPAPVAATWSKAGELRTPRVVTNLALLGSGEVLAVGADNVCGVESAGSDTTETWEPRSDTWTMASRLPSPRNDAVMVALADGRALVTGGANADYVAQSSTVLFDAANGAWSESGQLNTARMDPGIAALPDGRVLVAGGLLISETQEGGALDTTEIWDPTTGVWSLTGSLGGPRQGPAAVTLADGRVLLVGGFPRWGADEERPAAEIYDPRTGRWTPAGALAAPPSGLSVVALPDGGALAVRAEADDRVAVERYDAAANTWSATTYLELPSGVVRAMVAPLRDGRVLAVGSQDARIYDPETSTWSETAPMPGVRNDAAAALLGDGSVLMAGGWAEWLPDTPGCPTAEEQAWRFVPGMP